MSSPVNCNPCCSTETTTQIPGPQGDDASVVAPDTMDPEGVKTGNPGQAYLQTTDDSFWIKKTGTGNTGWLKLIGLWIFLFMVSSAFAYPPLLRTPFTTNSPTVTSNVVIAISDARIAADATHQQTNNNLTALSTNNAVNLTNLQASAIAGAKFTGVITNVSTLSTNLLYFSNGVLTNATIHL